VKPAFVLALGRTRIAARWLNDAAVDASWGRLHLGRHRGMDGMFGSVVLGDTDRSYDFTFVGRTAGRLRSRHMDGITTTWAGTLPSQIGPTFARNINQRAPDFPGTGNAWTAPFSSFENPGDGGFGTFARLGAMALAAHARRSGLGVRDAEG